MADRLDVTREDGIRRIAFDRPEKRNALDVRLVEELLEELDDAQTDAEDAILFTGNGPVTTAGADTSIVDGDDDAAKRALVEGVNDVYAFLASYPRPTVMAVKGAAIGAGFQLAVASDFAVAAENAVLSKPEIGYGVFSGYSTRMLKAALGANVAREIALRGDEIPPDRALEWGVVSDVVPQDAVEDRAEELIEQLAGYDHTAYEHTKAALSFEGAPDDYGNYP